MVYDLNGRVERIPAHELLDFVEGQPDEAVIRLGPQGLLDVTVGELRELAKKGQGVDVPRLLSDPRGIWEIER